MAFLIKNKDAHGHTAVLGQWVRCARPTSLILPQTTTQNIFKVCGGRIKVHLLIGTATTIFQNSDPVLKVTATAKNAAGATVGTAKDIGSTVDSSSLEVGGMLVVEGDGSALVKTTAGAAILTAGVGDWLCPQGYINIETGASKTGAAAWDIWYQPLDDGAYVEAVKLSATGV